MFRSTLICLATALAGLVVAGRIRSNRCGTATAGDDHALDNRRRSTRRTRVCAACEAGRGQASPGHRVSRSPATCWNASERMHIQTLWPQAIVVYPQGLNTTTPIDAAGTRRLAGQSGRPRRPRSQALRCDRRDDEGVLRGRQAPDLRDRILERRSLQPPALGRACEDDRGDRRGRRPARPRRDPDGAAAASGRGGTNRHGGSVRGPAADDPLARQIDGASGAGSPCGQYCTFYPSTNGPVPVKTFIHPGGHVYPGWAPAEIVKFFKSHKQP